MEERPDAAMLPPVSRRPLWLGPVVLLALIGIFGWILSHQDRDLATLLTPGALALALLAWIAVNLSLWMINGQRLRILLNHLKRRMPLIEAMQISASASLLNYLPLQTGFAARGIYLKKKHDLPYTSYLALLMGNYAVALLAHASVGFGICLFFLDKPGIRFLMVLYLVIFAASLFLTLLPFPAFLKNFLPNRLVSRLDSTHRSFQEIFGDRKCLLNLLIIEAFIMAHETIRFKLAFHFLGIEPNISIVLGVLMATLAAPTVLLNITPAGMGIRESAMAIVAAAWGYHAGEAFLAGSFDRFLTILVVLALGSLATWLLGRNFPAMFKNARAV